MDFCIFGMHSKALFYFDIFFQIIKSFYHFEMFHFLIIDKANLPVDSLNQLYNLKCLFYDNCFQIQGLLLVLFLVYLKKKKQ